MARKFDQIDKQLKRFIEQQKIFFVGTAATEGRVNVSPKGMDSLRILESNKVVWLNLTGSGNESSAHIQENGRITIMFCAFDGKPLILRLYGQAMVIHPRDTAWDRYIDLFPDYIGARQLIEIEIDLVQTSCGFGVPLYDFQKDRDVLTEWSENKGRQGIEAYWREENQTSLDDKPTNILQE